jgi:hypothetical protein
MLTDGAYGTFMHGRLTTSVLTDLHNDVTEMFLVLNLLGHFMRFCFFSKFICAVAFLT